MADQCPSCQSQRLRAGRLSAGLQLDETAASAGRIQPPAEIRVRVCLDCGNVDHFQVDVRQLRDMTDDG